MSKLIDAILSAKTVVVLLVIVLIIHTDMYIAVVPKHYEERVVVATKLNLDKSLSEINSDTMIHQSIERQDGQQSNSSSDTNDMPMSMFRNLRLVFLGDSVTRYQYLSLAYYLRYGHWYDTSITVNNLMNAHSYHHPFHPNEDWNEFFIQSNRILHPMEICDCIRGSGGGGSGSGGSTATTVNSTRTVNSTETSDDILVERRYFYDERHNNMLVYINMNGKETSSGGRGYYGRLQAGMIFTSNFSNMIGIVPGMEYSYQNRHASSTQEGNYNNNDDNTNNYNRYEHQNIQWEYNTWDEVIRYHIGLLDFSYNLPVRQQQLLLLPRAYVLLNAGLHPHDFHNEQTIQNVVMALHDTQLHGTWKTTTSTKIHVLNERYRKGGISNSTQENDEITTIHYDVQYNERRNVISTLMSDTYMCEALEHHCLNTSWIDRLRSPISQYYVDNLHFMEPIYRIMNEEYIQQLYHQYFSSSLLLPSNYENVDKTSMYIPYNRSQLLIQE